MYHPSCSCINSNDRRLRLSILSASPNPGGCRVVSLPSALIAMSSRISRRTIHGLSSSMSSVLLSKLVYILRCSVSCYNMARCAGSRACCLDPMSPSKPESEPPWHRRAECFLLRTSDSVPHLPIRVPAFSCPWIAPKAERLCSTPASSTSGKRKRGHVPAYVVEGLRDPGGRARAVRFAARLTCSVMHSCPARPRSQQRPRKQRSSRAH